MRLRWQIKDPIEEAIHVLEDPDNPYSAQTPYKSAEGALHPIHTAYIAERPVTHLELDIPALWNIIVYDEDTESDHTERENSMPSLDVYASDGISITIGDYIAAAHPWLVSLRERYLEDSQQPDHPLPADTELWVVPQSLLEGSIRIWEKDPNSPFKTEEEEDEAKLQEARELYGDSPSTPSPRIMALLKEEFGW